MDGWLIHFIFSFRTSDNQLFKRNVLQDIIITVLIFSFRDESITWVWPMAWRQYLQSKHRKCSLFFLSRRNEKAAKSIRKPLQRWKHLINWSYLWSRPTPSDRLNMRQQKRAWSWRALEVWSTRGLLAHCKFLLLIVARRRGPRQWEG